MSSIDLIYRYLKAREKINDTYGALAAIIEVNKDENGISGIEAVEIDKPDVKRTQSILDYTSLNSCFLNIDDRFVLLYPAIEREKYMQIQPFLAYGDKLIEYPGMTYSEASEMKEFMDVAGVKYKSKIDSDGKVGFIVAKDDEEMTKEMIKAISEEQNTEEGYKYFVSKNICWANAINQASIAISGSFTTYIGKEGGSGGIVIREDGAVLMTPNKSGEFIPRSDKDFKEKVINAVLQDLNGENTPVKAFFGDFADIISNDMKKQDIDKPALTLKDALEILQLDGLPSVDELDEMFGNIDEYEADEKRAFYAIARMVMCRTQKLDGFDEYKLSKAEKSTYSALHQEYVDKFTNAEAELVGYKDILSSKENKIMEGVNNER